MFWWLVLAVAAQRVALLAITFLPHSTVVYHSTTSAPRMNDTAQETTAVIAILVEYEMQILLTSSLEPAKNNASSKIIRIQSQEELTYYRSMLACIELMCWTEQVSNIHSYLWEWE